MNETEAKRYHLAKKLFLEALEQPAEQRSAYLNKACPDDAKLRREVAALLADHDRLPDTPVLPKLAMPSGDSPGPLPERVGPFKILEELGHGGMGVVYLAERDRPHQRVALKVIKLGMDTKAVLARFEAEQEALALMDHPGVAKMYQAGATQEGQPYFAMEYVAGLPITEYCDEHRLNTTQRLKLFMEVCQAVQHAHQKGIIHRDIKPSNVLVTEKDDKPIPKVIDFGVARSTAQRLTEQTLFTQQGQLVGTPEYMSPEQAGHNIRNIDTRTDVYSLGVLLYELLVGALPFDRKTLREAALGEIQRMIREDDPPTPSTRLSKLGDTSTTIAEHRATTRNALARQLRDDLDAITMMAMHKNRKHRYATATAFADDIQRHLSDEPITAPRPGGVSYRLRKYVRRNKGPVTAVASIIVILFGAGLISTGLYMRTERMLSLANQRAHDLNASNKRALHAEDEATRRAEELQAMYDRVVNAESVAAKRSSELEESIMETSRAYKYSVEHAPEEIARDAWDYIVALTGSETDAWNIAGIVFLTLITTFYSINMAVLVALMFLILKATLRF